jgi:hypothetical protein
MWIDSFDFKEKVLSVYQGCPSLDDAYLHEVKLHQDGPHCTLRFNLRDYPNAPPKEWLEKGYNTVQLTMQLWGLKTIEIRGFSTENYVNIHFDRFDQQFKFSVTGTTNISGVADFAMIEKLSAYKRER